MKMNPLNKDTITVEKCRYDPLLVFDLRFAIKEH